MLFHRRYHSIFKAPIWSMLLLCSLLSEIAQTRYVEDKYDNDHFEYGKYNKNIYDEDKYDNEKYTDGEHKNDKYHNKYKHDKYDEDRYDDYNIVDDISNQDKHQNKKNIDMKYEKYEYDKDQSIHESSEEDNNHDNYNKDIFDDKYRISPDNNKYNKDRYDNHQHKKDRYDEYKYKNEGDKSYEDTIKYDKYDEDKYNVKYKNNIHNNGISNKYIDDKYDNKKYTDKYNDIKYDKKYNDDNYKENRHDKDRHSENKYDDDGGYNDNRYMEKISQRDRDSDDNDDDYYSVDNYDRNLYDDYEDNYMNDDLFRDVGDHSRGTESSEKHDETCFCNKDVKGFENAQHKIKDDIMKIFDVKRRVSDVIKKISLLTDDENNGGNDDLQNLKGAMFLTCGCTFKDLKKDLEEIQDGLTDNMNQIGQNMHDFMKGFEKAEGRGKSWEDLSKEKTEKDSGEESVEIHYKPEDHIEGHNHMSCFRCQNYEEDDDNTYCPDCSDDEYQGLNASMADINTCVTSVWYNNKGAPTNRVERHGSPLNDTMSCLIDTDDHRMHCYCDEPNCNNDNCQHCFKQAQEFTCYYCQNFDKHNLFDNTPYDPNCGDEDYKGITEYFPNAFGCMTIYYYKGEGRWENGIRRVPDRGLPKDWINGMNISQYCERSGHGFKETMDCYCRSSKCNNDRCKTCFKDGEHGDKGRHTKSQNQHRSPTDNRNIPKSNIRISNRPKTEITESNKPNRNIPNNNVLNSQGTNSNRTDRNITNNTGPKNGRPNNNIPKSNRPNNNTPDSNNNRPNINNPKENFAVASSESSEYTDWDEENNNGPIKWRPNIKIPNKNKPSINLQDSNGINNVKINNNRPNINNPKEILTEASHESSKSTEWDEENKINNINNNKNKGNKKLNGKPESIESLEYVDWFENDSTENKYGYEKDTRHKPHKSTEKHTGSNDHKDSKSPTPMNNEKNNIFERIKDQNKTKPWPLNQGISIPEKKEDINKLVSICKLLSPLNVTSPQNEESQNNSNDTALSSLRMQDQLSKGRPDVSNEWQKSMASTSEEIMKKFKPFNKAHDANSWSDENDIELNERHRQNHSEFILTNGHMERIGGNNEESGSTSEEVMTKFKPVNKEDKSNRWRGENDREKMERNRKKQSEHKMNHRHRERNRDGEQRSSYEEMMKEFKLHDKSDKINKHHEDINRNNVDKDNNKHPERSRGHVDREKTSLEFKPFGKTGEINRWSEEISRENIEGGRTNQDKENLGHRHNMKDKEGNEARERDKTNRDRWNEREGNEPMNRTVIFADRAHDASNRGSDSMRKRPEEKISHRDQSRSDFLSCHRCHNYQVSYDVKWFDEDCGNDNYKGLQYEYEEGNTCVIYVYYDSDGNPDGRVSRFGRAEKEEDGTCLDYPDSNRMKCFCSGQNCNKHLCQHCFERNTQKPKTCYRCHNDKNGKDFDWYDPKCGEENYDGLLHSYKNAFSCVTFIYYDENGIPNGQVSRYGGVQESEDEVCQDYPDQQRMKCYCSNNHCNKNLCQSCFGKEVWDKRTQESFHENTEERRGENELSSERRHLECYHCVGDACKEVDNKTDIDSSHDFDSCYTAYYIDGETTVVFRGGDEDFHKEGECIRKGRETICFCNSNRCNFLSWKTVADRMENSEGRMGNLNSIAEKNGKQEEGSNSNEDRNRWREEGPKRITEKERNENKGYISKEDKNLWLAEGSDSKEEKNRWKEEGSNLKEDKNRLLKGEAKPIEEKKESLRCYSCLGDNCSEVNKKTDTEASIAFTSCYTGHFTDGSSEAIFRGGDVDDHIDGECISNAKQYVCYCTTNLCNSELLEHKQISDSKGRDSNLNSIAEKNRWQEEDKGRNKEFTSKEDKNRWNAIGSNSKEEKFRWKEGEPNLKENKNSWIKEGPKQIAEKDRWSNEGSASREDKNRWLVEESNSKEEKNSNKKEGSSLKDDKNRWLKEELKSVEEKSRWQNKGTNSIIENDRGQEKEKYLSCYHCLGVNCSEVNTKTETEASEAYTSCYTGQFTDGSSEAIFRGGDVDDHTDGECIGNAKQYVCYCTTNLCNDELWEYQEISGEEITDGKHGSKINEKYHEFKSRSSSQEERTGNSRQATVDYVEKEEEYLDNNISFEKNKQRGSSRRSREEITDDKHGSKINENYHEYKSRSSSQEEQTGNSRQATVDYVQKEEEYLDNNISFEKNKQRGSSQEESLENSKKHRSDKNFKQESTELPDNDKRSKGKLKFENYPANRSRVESAESKGTKHPEGFKENLGGSIKGTEQGRGHSKSMSQSKVKERGDDNKYEEESVKGDSFHDQNLRNKSNKLSHGSKNRIQYDENYIIQDKQERKGDLSNKDEEKYSERKSKDKYNKSRKKPMKSLGTESDHSGQSSETELRNEVKRNNNHENNSRKNYHSNKHKKEHSERKPGIKSNEEHDTRHNEELEIKSSASKNKGKSKIIPEDESKEILSETSNSSQDISDKIESISEEVKGNIARDDSVAKGSTSSTSNENLHEETRNVSQKTSIEYAPREYSTERDGYETDENSSSKSEESIHAVSQEANSISGNSESESRSDYESESREDDGSNASDEESAENSRENTETESRESEENTEMEKGNGKRKLRNATQLPKNHMKFKSEKHKHTKKYLECYTCTGVDCKKVDHTTETDSNQTFASCYTGHYVDGSSDIIFRGGDTQVHKDGECVKKGHKTICYCISNLCNSKLWDSLKNTAPLYKRRKKHH